LLQAAPDRAAACLTDALALWHGVPLAEFTQEPFARGEVPRLRELQLSALTSRIQADLAVGRHDQLIANWSTSPAVTRCMKAFAGSSC
jgi:hypothetical protein